MSMQSSNWKKLARCWAAGSKARLPEAYVEAYSACGALKSTGHFIKRYLESLRLRLHPRKCHVRPVAAGLRFLGQIIYPDRRLLPQSNVRRFMQRMRKFQRLYASGERSLDQIRPSLQSWLGHARQAHTLALRQGLLEKVSFQRNIHRSIRSI